ncbi:alpha-mannosidase [Ktedonosporobacter rubrisoli]|nr:glycoside hydrolase family 38 C-terminal domain-containing protein [Ktedonosporobacter rubrisoli]
MPLTALQVEAWITPEPVPFAERLSGAHKELSIGQSWGKLWDCAWFHFTGTVPEQAGGKAIVLLIDLSGEACVVDQVGNPVLGLTTVSSTFDKSLGRPGKRVVPLTEQAHGSEVIDLWADAGCNDLFGVYQDSGSLKEAHIALYSTEMYQLYYDFAVLYELMQELPEDTARRHRILAALHKASLELVEYSSEEAQRARTILAPELAKTGGTPSLKVSAIGHAHIDLAWLWPLRETIRKGARSFATTLALMERYQDYIFGASQPQLYQWMKTYYPALYKRIQARVAEGRWEIQGAMWIEPDTNVPSGEALVRQLIYGKRFFREEFGKDPRMLWLPDVFGYTAALPQILKKAGVDYFLTIKLSWNTFNVFPHHTFLWQGIDGTQVLAHMPPEGTYNSSAAPRAIRATEKNFADKVVSEECVLLYGIGDGGGGPGREHLEYLARERNLEGLAPVKQEPIENFFQRIAEKTDEYKTWVGELYLEKHQGTYTTQARSKRFNRKLELALRELEFFSFLALITAGQPYPSQQLDAIWQEVLLYQFHDILPGSSIKRVYDESLARYQELSNQVKQLTKKAQATLIRQPQANRQTYTIFNSLSWVRSEWLQVQGQWRYVTVPSLGYSSLEITEQLANDAPTQLVASAQILENDLLQLRFAPDGAIQAIFDKEHQRDVLAPQQLANRLSLYHDNGDAWDFPMDYDERPALSFALESSHAFLTGPQAIMEQHYSFGQSTLRQQVILTKGSRRIDFVTTVDWRESHKMLRTSFPLNVSATEATCDIQFGTIKRPTHHNTSIDMARYEVCAHKWVDLSQADYGVALLNDCKYGHKISQNVLDLNLLRSPHYPDPQADLAQHEFTYALFPHAGDHVAGQVMRAGYELNVPLDVIPGELEGSASLPEASLVQISAENVILEGVKKAEQNDDLILRLYESAGATTRTELIAGIGIAEIWKTNLLEEKEARLEHTGRKVEVVLGPFEILTLRLQPAR